MAAVVKEETIPIASSSDIVRVRQVVRTMAVSVGFTLVDQTKIITAASELARNALDHGGGGRVEAQVIQNELRHGLKLVFIDAGPGISDVEKALRDGFTTGNGMGLGLGGARRLVNEFNIDSAPGRGTTVMITRWRNT